VKHGWVFKCALVGARFLRVSERVVVSRVLSPVGVLGMCGYIRLLGRLNVVRTSRWALRVDPWTRKSWSSGHAPSGEVANPTARERLGSDGPV
jgi:hypothetical protein